MGDIFDEIDRIANQADLEGLDGELKTYYNELNSAMNAKDSGKLMDVLARSPGLMKKMMRKQVQFMDELIDVKKKYVSLLDKHEKVLRAMLDDQDRKEDDG